MKPWINNRHHKEMLQRCQGPKSDLGTEISWKRETFWKGTTVSDYYSAIQFKLPQIQIQILHQNKKRHYYIQCFLLKNADGIKLKGTNLNFWAEKHQMQTVWCVFFLLSVVLRPLFAKEISISIRLPDLIKFVCMNSRLPPTPKASLLEAEEYTVRKKLVLGLEVLDGSNSGLSCQKPEFKDCL